MTKKSIKRLIITLAIIFFANMCVNAQSDTNVLPLHTGKSYILDFPVKVTRVVGGDPSAMELNLFKKDENSTEDTGYQLLISPISEKNTNIIVWTEGGLYVFEVLIDNNSLYTAETIVDVPVEKKFVVPIMQVAQTNIQPVETEDNIPPQTYLKADEMVQNPNNEGYTVYEEGESSHSFIDDNVATSIDDPPQLTDQNKNFYPPVVNNNKETGAAGAFELDDPPKPDLEPLKPVKQKNVSKKKDPVHLKPSVKIASSQKHKQPQNEKVIDFEFKPQQPTNNTMMPQPVDENINLLRNNVEYNNDGLQLVVDSVKRDNNTLKIALSLKNTSTICKYLLWDLTRVNDNKGNSLYVRNHNLPPGIVTPGKKIKGEIIAYPKSDDKQLPVEGILNLALLGLQGDTIFDAELPIGK